MTSPTVNQTVGSKCPHAEVINSPIRNNTLILQLKNGQQMRSTIGAEILMEGACQRRLPLSPWTTSQNTRKSDVFTSCVFSK
ncbi:hypothetical protein JTE90_009437 [Oedothorax gibbosus]|uniref:Uncharacterized protein n=1 Tax=Oedothorax gibbosus TaxID=931172 RepID=A0AAV6VVR8_9ARAC|nr:hypothetical protein JTE90_009437 [Oedothorax gibbosus]